MKKYLPLMLLLLFVALGCASLSSAQKLESEKATENPNKTISDSQIFLNREDKGKISDIGKKVSLDDPKSFIGRPLGETLRAITDEREANGVFIEGTNEISAKVYLNAEPELALGPLTQLYLVIAENSGGVYIRKTILPKQNQEVVRPDPTYLEVRTGPESKRTDAQRMTPTYDPDHKYTYDTSFEFAKTADSLLSDRAWAGSVELSADERLFINDAQGAEADKGPKHTQVKQRLIGAAALKAELKKIISSDGQILIIASEKASYGKLLSIFESMSDQKVKFRVVIRPNVLN